MAKRTLQISKIRLDGNTQPRVELDESLIAEYKEAYKSGAPMPPLKVMFDGASYWLWDGFHRRWGGERAGLDKLPCNVTNGTREDAQWASYGANKDHGLRRRNADKEKAVKAALRHPNGPGKSDVEIADHCGVASNTVLKYRNELVSTSQIAKSDVRTGKDGRTINTTNIGRKPDSDTMPGADEPETDADQEDYESPEVEQPEDDAEPDEVADDGEIDGEDDEEANNEAFPRVLAYLTEGHLESQGGYPYDYAIVYDKLVLASLDPGKEYNATKAEVYDMEYLEEWENAATEYKHEHKCPWWEAIGETEPPRESDN